MTDFKKHLMSGLGAGLVLLIVNILLAVGFGVYWIWQWLAFR